jgi:hypothetical protein
MAGLGIAMSQQVARTRARSRQFVRGKTAGRQSTGGALR